MRCRWLRFVSTIELIASEASCVIIVPVPPPLIIRFHFVPALLSFLILPAFKCIHIILPILPLLPRLGESLAKYFHRFIIAELIVDTTSRVGCHAIIVPAPHDLHISRHHFSKDSAHAQDLQNTSVIRTEKLIYYLQFQLLRNRQIKNSFKRSQ